MNPTSTSTAAAILFPLARAHFATAREAYRYVHGLIRRELNRPADKAAAMANRAEAWLNS